jgi:hypothetical protein
VGLDRDAWADAVRRAAIAQDEAALAALFAQGRRELGAQVSREWAAILSALDAGAVTG